MSLDFSYSNGGLFDNGKIKEVAPLMRHSMVAAGDRWRAKNIAAIVPSKEWGFATLTQKDTRYATHGYHRYPAKYIPQLAQKMILAYSRPNDLVIDPFGGCGTTAVEAKINGRRGLAIDINPVAVMISNSKINAIEPSLLNRAIARFWQKHGTLSEQDKHNIMGRAPNEERINYWFRPSEKEALAQILFVINSEKNKASKQFLVCAFSNILKNCSMWHMKSNKPLYHTDKIPSAPVAQFCRQLKTMVRMNGEYWRLLQDRQNGGIDCTVRQGSAVDIPVADDDAHLVVTSPPYVTSYEYADLHQLTALWMGWMSNLPQFRRDFIGSSYTQRTCGGMNSQIASDIVSQLGDKNAAMGSKAAVYFSDMSQVFADIYRVLRAQGHACIVIGDTELRGVKIQNTRVFIDQMENLGFTIRDVFCRQVSSKCIPSTRDNKTGKFTSVKKSDKIAYPTEYIIVAQKQ